MQIEVLVQAEGVTGTEEVWVNVQSDTIVDLADIKRAMTADQLATLARCQRQPLAYYPGDDEDSSYSFADLWVFRPLEERP